MDLFDKIVRIPNNLDKDVNIEFYPSNECNKIYGLSIFSRGATEWKSYIGTFPFLYGIWINLGHSNKIYDQMNNNLVKSKIDLDDDFHETILFNIDSKDNPINLIKSVYIRRDELNKDIIMDKISYLYDQYYDDQDCNRLPKLIFKK